MLGTSMRCGLAQEGAVERTPFSVRLFTDTETAGLMA
jgi:hypothetical protein